MIRIEERIPDKMPGLSSLFVSFDYNAAIVEAIKTLPNYTYNKKTYTWELPVTNLAKMLELFNGLDDISLMLLKDEPNIKSNITIDTTNYKTKPFEHQIEAVEYGLNNDKFLLLDAPGLGKAVSLDTKVYTPDGFKLMNDIQTGDYVIDSNGNPTKVLATYLNSNLKMYKVTFSDNSSVVCCEDHLWQLNCKRRGTLVRPLKWLLDNDQFGNPRKINKFWIPKTAPVKFNEKPIKLHPYILGCLLGDGCITRHPILASADTELVSRFSSFLPESVYLKNTAKYTYYISSKNPQYKSNEVKAALKYYNLLGCNSENKFIPKDYLYNSVENRYELLRGLLDTDGFASKENLVQYSTNSIQLRDDIIELAESLGAICSTYSKTPKYNGKACHINYIITIKADDPTLLFSLVRKKERLHIRHFKPLRRFKSIEPVEETTGKCITVDSPTALYLINNYIVTHNTKSIIDLANELRIREGLEHCLIICGINTLKMNWKKEVSIHSDLSCRILGERITKKGKYKIGSVKDRLEDLKNPIDEFFVITNIETLRNDDIVKELTKGKANKFDMIVVDEIHKASSSQSQQGKNLLKLQAKHLIGATGTLLTSNPVNAYGPLKWIGAEQGTFTNFKFYYCNYTGQFNNILIGFRNLNVLQDQIDKYSLRRTKDLLNLPPKNIIHEFVEMEPDQTKFYNNIKEGIVKDVDLVDIKPAALLSMITRLRQVTSFPGILTSTEIESSKINRACDLAEQMVSNNEKVIIFSVFKPTLDALAKKLADYKPVICTGDTKPEIRAINIDQFQTNPECKILLATVQAMGTGVTLTAATNEIFIDAAWTAAENLQAEDRIHRISAEKPVFIYYLWNTDTIDERVKEIVESKEAISDYIVDNKIQPKLASKLREIVQDLIDE